VSCFRSPTFARLLCLAGFSAILATGPTAAADARGDYLIRLLRGSSQFRVRAQAAISLGNAAASAEVLAALSLSLKDEHPAVRAAAATSLGMLGDARALDALRAASADSEGPVQLAARGAIAKLDGMARMAGSAATQPAGPRGPPRYYLAFGRPGTRAPGVSPELLDRAQGHLQRSLQTIDGVVLAPPNEARLAAEGVLRQRKLKGFYIDSSITSVEEKEGGGTRAAVSVIVQTYPGRDMRAIMQGAATVMGGGDEEDRAVESALSSALRQLPQALARE
jgi:hypothetical protein